MSVKWIAGSATRGHAILIVYGCHIGTIENVQPYHKEHLFIRHREMLTKISYLFTQTRHISNNTIFALSSGILIGFLCLFCVFQQLDSFFKKIFFSIFDDEFPDVFKAMESAEWL